MTVVRYHPGWIHVRIISVAEVVVSHDARQKVLLTTSVGAGQGGQAVSVTKVSLYEITFLDVSKPFIIEESLDHISS